ncbi:MAG: hypothetical protein V1915_03320 [Candidatus Bathyarchaeota archaeon]
MVRKGQDSPTLRDVIRPGIIRGFDLIILSELWKRTSINPQEIPIPHVNDLDFRECLRGEGE